MAQSTNHAKPEVPGMDIARTWMKAAVAGAESLCAESRKAEETALDALHQGFEAAKKQQTILKDACVQTLDAFPAGKQMKPSFEMAAHLQQAAAVAVADGIESAARLTAKSVNEPARTFVIDGLRRAAVVEA